MSGRRRIDKLLDPAYLERAEEAPAQELRLMLKECQEEEDVLSFQRRFIHGKLDILRAEAERRDRGGPSLSGIVDRLGDILGAGPAAGRGAHSRIRTEVPLDARRELDRLVSADHLSRLPELPPQELDDLISLLTGAERKVSSERRGLLRVIDALQQVLVRRYKDGATSPAEVLHPPGR